MVIKVLKVTGSKSSIVIVKRDECAFKINNKKGLLMQVVNSVPCAVHQQQT